jgi:hypothetical protein
MTMTKLDSILGLLMAAGGLAAVSPATAGSALDGNHERPRYISNITGNPEKDTFGYVVSVQPDASVIWSDATGFVGARSGHAESDTFGRKVLQRWPTAGVRTQD